MNTPDSKREYFFESLHRLSLATLIEDCDRILGQILKTFSKVQAYALFVQHDESPVLQAQRHAFHFRHQQLPQISSHNLAQLFSEDSSPYRILSLEDCPVDEQAMIQKKINGCSADFLVLFQEEDTIYAAILLQGRPRLCPQHLTLLLDTSSLVLKNLFFAQQVAIDQLTRLYRRAFFFRRLCHQLGNQPLRPLVVMMIDIDKFKKINDLHGHIYGDFVLRSICAQIKNSFRKQDLLSRFGGDEFAIFLPETDVNQGLVIAQRVRQNVEKLKLLHDGGSLTVSIGLKAHESALPSPATLVSRLAQQLLAEADAALYLAKKQGRNRVVCQSSPSSVSCHIGLAQQPNPG